MAFQKHNNKGFAMVELIIAIAILSLGIMTTYTALSGVLSTTYSISSRFTAVYLAKEGMEIFRNIRDYNFIHNNSWSQDIVGCNSGCQADYKTKTAAQGSPNQLQPYNDNNFLQLTSDGFFGYDSGTATIFKRKITTTEVNSDTLKVIVEVFWKYNGKDFNFSTENYLYNWY